MPKYTVEQQATVSMKIEAATPEEAAWIYSHHTHVLVSAEDKTKDPRVTEVVATWTDITYLFGGDLAVNDTREV